LLAVRNKTNPEGRCNILNEFDIWHEDKEIQIIPRGQIGYDVSISVANDDVPEDMEWLAKLIVTKLKDDGLFKLKMKKYRG